MNSEDSQEQNVVLSTYYSVTKWSRFHAIAQQVQNDLDSIANQHLECPDTYENVWDMWQKELKMENGDISKLKWYSDGVKYWDNPQNCSISEDGVLGGYGHVSDIDIQGSRQFIMKLKYQKPLWRLRRAVDCGAGIGRVAKYLLLPLFEQVDLVEPSARLLQNANDYVCNLELQYKIGELINTGLEDFNPVKNRYDLVWIQWVLPHLTDVDVIEAIDKCLLSLTQNGLLILKENANTQGLAYEIDHDDSSITRSNAYYQSLFRQLQTPMEIVMETTQNLPDDLLPVKMYALARK